jgi:prepilin-type N-terminal cleavage/methylation domain-containing protein
MKKNGFTLVELIAVLVILSIIALLAAPNIITLMQNSKEKAWLSEVKEMVSTATYMYKTNKDVDTIYMKNLTGTIPVTDPYGYTYVIENSASDNEFSYFKFKEPDESTSMGKREITVFIKSCKTDNSGKKCHYLCSNDGANLKLTDIGDSCSIS